MEGIGLPDGCLLGLKIKGIGIVTCWGLWTHMGSMGKQISLPLHHHCATGTGTSMSCLLSDLHSVSRSHHRYIITDRHWHWHVVLIVGVNDDLQFPQK